MVNVESGMNPVAMTIINPWKVFCRVGDQTRDLQFSSPVHHRLNYRSSMNQNLKHFQTENKCCFKCGPTYSGTKILQKYKKKHAYTPKAF